MLKTETKLCQTQAEKEKSNTWKIIVLKEKNCCIAYLIVLTNFRMFALVSKYLSLEIKKRFGVLNTEKNFLIFWKYVKCGKWSSYFKVGKYETKIKWALIFKLKTIRNYT